jgi:signal transduction histidine kinase
MRLQEEERRRIARELHDSTGQNLAALKLNLSRLNSAHLPPDLERVAVDSIELADRMLAEIRTLSHLLHPPLLDELGLVSAIRTYADGWRALGNCGLPMSWRPASRPSWKPRFFASSEGPTNIYRHSGGRSADHDALEGGTLQLNCAMMARASRWRRR